jgi:NAD(P)-dependent dehydrogenase (short-subunit alcohol dehydrogenase family)
MTSSEAHRISPVRFSDYNLEPGKKVEKEDEPRRGLPKGVLRGGGAYEPAVAYGQSKTANVLFAVGLNQRLNKDGVKSFAVMPGSMFFFMLM